MNRLEQLRSRYSYNTIAKNGSGWVSKPQVRNKKKPREWIVKRMKKALHAKERNKIEMRESQSDTWRKRKKENKKFLILFGCYIILFYR